MDDPVYEQLTKIIHESGQTAQTFYETYAKRVLSTYHINDSEKTNRKIEAFYRFEELKKESPIEIDD